MKTPHLKDIADITARRKAMLDDATTSPMASVLTYADGCALGRWLDKDLCLKLDSMDDSTVFAVEHLLPPWMREMDWRFLAEIQSLHDQLPYWDPFDGYKRLNNHGLEFADLIRKQWGLQ